MNNFRYKYKYNTFKGLYGGKTKEKVKKKKLCKESRKRRAFSRFKD